MAKPLDDRIAAAMGHGARAATIAELTAEVAATIAETQAEHERLDVLSKSATATEDEADAAADEAVKLARKVLRLTAKKQQLETRHEELLNSERRKNALAEYQRVKEARDDLCARLKDRWPKITDEIIGLLREIEANDAEIDRVNTNLYGSEWLASAEAVARGRQGFNTGSDRAIRLTKMKIPSLHGPGQADLAWPAPAKHPLDVAHQAERRQREAAAKQRMEEAAKWKRYVVTPPEGNSSLIPVETRNGQQTLRGMPAIFVMAPDQVEQAECRGCTARLAGPNESIGMPAGATFLS
jgi:hypothetical protein